MKEYIHLTGWRRGGLKGTIIKQTVTPIWNSTAWSLERYTSRSDLLTCVLKLICNTSSYNQLHQLVVIFILQVLENSAWILSASARA